MPYLLLGPDEFSKEEFIKTLAKAQDADLEIFNDAASLPSRDQLSQTDLFSKAKIFLFQGLVPEYLGSISKSSESKNKIIASINSLDKRKKENKDLLASGNIELKEFFLPHGFELNGWIENRFKELGGKISKTAIEELAVRLGRDNGKETKVGGKIISAEEVFSLNQADSEIRKLLAFANGEEITITAVKDLVPENGETDVFDLTNAIADNQKQKAVILMHRFLRQESGSDEKGAVIQLNALLSEQFRNVSAVQDFLKNKISEDGILEKTSWKPGRLFVLKKAAGRFEPKKVLEFLNRLEALDQELKTSQVPPKVILDLIVGQLLS